MGARKEKKKKNESFFDYTLLFIVLFLLIFGLVILYSTSSYSASLEHKDPAYFLKKQLFASTVGVVFMLFASKFDYHHYRFFAWIIYAVGAVVSILLVLTPLGRTINGARRWINIGISVQPAEIAKLSLIVFLATFICAKGKQIREWKNIGYVALFAGIPAGLILIVTKNLSSCIIVLGIAVFMLFVADSDYGKYFLALIIVAIFAAIVVLVIVKKHELSPGNVDFRGERILAWLDPEAFADDEGFQTLQALYAIGSGGFWGKGLGQSMQKLGFLPEAQNDMVFSIICEELGLFGALCVILLFVFLIWRFMFIANNAPDLYGALLVVGVMGHISIQVILNIAVVTNSIPNTGITLPFISYGGTSVVFLLIEIGIVLNVSSKIRLMDVG